MRKIAVFLITLYQYTLSPVLRVVLGTTCRYEVSCSVYAKQSIQKFGIGKGGLLALHRLLSCQPFGTIRK